VIVMTVRQMRDTAPAAGGGRWPARPDPGDLSRRLSARRAELGLTVNQVAARAGVQPRYLDYLENFPGHPDAATLRHLAAALHTTSAALLGAGRDAAPGNDPDAACWSSAGQLERLSQAECHRLLAPRGMGRVGFATASGTVIVPVNYTMAGGSIVIRTSAGSVIGAHGDGAASFQADHFDLEAGEGWSVLAIGDAHRVLQPAEQRCLREQSDPRPWPGGEHDLFIRIVPAQLTGRRITTR
jgi:transcriptional regulator with XRE-family HTH domain